VAFDRLIDAFVSAGGGCAGGRAGSAATFAAFAAAEELEVLEDNFHFAAFLTGRLVVPSVELEAAFDEERTALGQILGDGFALFAPGLDIDKGRLIAGGAGLVLELAVNRESELADGGALRRDPEFRITRQVANEHYFVEGGHGSAVFARLIRRSGGTCGKRSCSGGGAL
jgi:hypothetical protein